MKKIIAIGIIIGLGVLVYFIPSMYKRTSENQIDQLADGNIKEEEILPLAKAAESDTLDFSVEQLQVKPDTIVEFNAMVMKVMYQNGEDVDLLTEEDIELLVKVQRKYYHEDLLAINDLDLHVLGAVREVERARDGESWIVDYTVGSPVYDSSDNDTAIVDVTFVPNSIGVSTDINQRYVVERVKGLWYIKGWSGLGEDETINLD